MLRQPNTELLSQQWLPDADSEYKDLCRLEAECIDGYEKLHPLNQRNYLAKQVEVSADKWLSLRVLHEQLLNKNIGFLFYSSISGDFRTLVTERSIPARILRFGVHVFLEIAKYHLPGSQDQMHAYISYAYPVIQGFNQEPFLLQDDLCECFRDLIW